ncbi:protoplasts-secreted [Savitreella phatthalungensis]
MRSVAIISAVAIGGVFAQSASRSSSSATRTGTNSACTQNVFTISSSSDLTAIQGCQTVSGTLNISPSISQINLGSIQQLNGDLNVINNGTGSTTLAATTQISAPSLQSISGTLTLTQLTQLNQLSMQSLTKVGGLSLTTLPVLSTLGFGGITQASSISIFDTLLSSLNGLDLRSVDTFIVSQNRYITAISLPSLTQVRTALTISANAEQLAVSFPKLTSAGNFTIQKVGNLSINALSNVTGSMGIQQNFFGILQANNLSYVTGDLFITNNTQLTNVSMPNLQSVSGFQIANNSQLADLNFPSLQTVAGAVDFTGTFSTIEVPALKDVRGGANVQTTSSSFSCPSQFKSGSGVVKGTIQACKGSVSSPTKGNTTSGGSSGTSSGSSSTTSSRSGSEQLTASIAAGMLGLVAFIL